MRNYSFLLGILLILGACAPKNAMRVGIAFNQPQPEGIGNLKKIPSSYIGRFYDKDSNLLEIDQNYIISKYLEVLKISKLEADTSKDCHIENQHIFFKSLNEKLPFTIKDDTLYIKNYYPDTLYNPKSDFIRKFKGYHILNSKSGNLWNVSILSIKSKNLKIYDFAPEDIFEKLTKLSNAEVQSDETKAIVLNRFLKPTRKQFENLLNYKDSLSVVIFKKTKVKN